MGGLDGWRSRRRKAARGGASGPGTVGLTNGVGQITAAGCAPARRGSRLGHRVWLAARAHERAARVTRDHAGGTSPVLQSSPEGWCGSSV